MPRSAGPRSGGVRGWERGQLGQPHDAAAGIVYVGGVPDRDGRMPRARLSKHLADTGVSGDAARRDVMEPDSLRFHPLGQDPVRPATGLAMVPIDEKEIRPPAVKLLLKPRHRSHMMTVTLDQRCAMSNPRLRRVMRAERNPDHF